MLTKQKFLSSWHAFELKRIADRRGSLTFIENDSHLPFAIQRVYYLYDVPSGESRGAHAHRLLQQVIVAASGSFDVTLSDGRRSETFNINRPDVGLYIPRMIWRDIQNFSGGAVCLVLASARYDENDYIRHYGEFLNLIRRAS